MSEEEKESYNRRILIVDDTPSIHEDIKQILLPAEKSQSSEELDDLDDELFGSEETADSSVSLNGEEIIEDYRVDSAYQGEEGIELVRKADAGGDPYSLVFMDVRMPPGIDGIETISRIWSEFPNIEIVICTAYSDYSWEKIVDTCGRTDSLLFLKKPFEAPVVKQMALSLTKKWNLKKKTQNFINNLEGEVKKRTSELELINGKLTHQITEKEKAQDELEVQRSKAVYSAKMASLGEMAAGIAHEINNPLTVIITSAELLMEIITESNISVDTVNNYSEKIQKMAERISKIVKGLKNISRDSDSDPFLDTQIKSVIDETLEFCMAKFKKDNIVINVSDYDENLTLKCRATEIAQVLLNLLGNSYDAIKDANIEGEKWIQINIEDTEDRIKMDIIDCGKGIPDDIREKIMQPFFTTKEIGKGTGLGIPISKGLIESHRGTFEIDANSENTKFVIILPKNPDAA
jgi:two-component system, NtrC family, sensor kinase